MVIQAVSQITHQIVHIDELLIAVFAISTVVVSNFILHIKWLCHIESIQPVAIIGGADGPTAIFVTSFYDAQALWGMAVKVFSNVVVVVLNYVFSKLIVFKRK